MEHAKQTFEPFTLEIFEDEDGRAKIIIADHPEGPSFVDRLSISIGTHQFNIERSEGVLCTRVINVAALREKLETSIMLAVELNEDHA
jgi:hypothetical protein